MHPLLKTYVNLYLFFLISCFYSYNFLNNGITGKISNSIVDGYSANSWFCFGKVFILEAVRGFTREGMETAKKVLVSDWFYFGAVGPKALKAYIHNIYICIIHIIQTHLCNYRMWPGWRHWSVMWHRICIFFLLLNVFLVHSHSFSCNFDLCFLTTSTKVFL